MSGTNQEGQGRQGGFIRAAKDYFSGTAGGIAQVLVGQVT
jgi:hypothetical protein